MKLCLMPIGTKKTFCYKRYGPTETLATRRFSLLNIKQEDKILSLRSNDYDAIMMMQQKIFVIFGFGNSHPLQLKKH